MVKINGDHFENGIEENSSRGIHKDTGVISGFSVVSIPLPET